ncbi:hypothetical protein PIB30_034213 [Stylosanthes scabra]|uniref:Aminotransferase-like plant mobile domain-containing protein n=1 Tax=Stylosanthes scabra TaxID=79078 RepID=A0ABU6SCF3_9FABA|nr:hypothetical protein [Stylosanthes scabra]
MCRELLGAILSNRDRQRNKCLRWFQDTVCRDLGDDPTPERLQQYMRGYIMLIIGGFLFPDASNSRLHLSRCVEGYILSKGTLGGCASLLLSWAYYCIHACRPQGDFDEVRFPLVERWRGLYMARDSLDARIRMSRMILNGNNHRGVEWTPYDDPEFQGIVPGDVTASHPTWGLVCLLLCFVIIKWHQVVFSVFRVRYKQDR